MASSKQPRRRFRFSLRLLFSVMLILSLVLAWIAVQLKWIGDRRRALEWIRPLRARQIAATRGEPVPSGKGFYVSHGERDAPWMLAIFGERGVDLIEVDQRWLDVNGRYNVENLRSLFPEAEFVLDSSPTLADGLQAKTGEYPSSMPSENE